jgi:hypothetical protein
MNKCLSPNPYWEAHVFAECRNLPVLSIVVISSIVGTLSGRRAAHYFWACQSHLRQSKGPLSLCENLHFSPPSMTSKPIISPVVSKHGDGLFAICITTLHWLPIRAIPHCWRLYQYCDYCCALLFWRCILFCSHHNEATIRKYLNHVSLNSHSQFSRNASMWAWKCETTIFYFLFF